MHCIPGFRVGRLVFCDSLLDLIAYGPFERRLTGHDTLIFLRLVYQERYKLTFDARLLAII